MLTIGSIVIRVDDLERQKAFWTAALDYVPRGEDRGDTTASRCSARGPATARTSRSTASAPRSTIPPRIHLDLYTEDQAGEVRRLIGLGATEVHWDKRPPDADYVIMADPEGNRFCVIDLTR